MPPQIPPMEGHNGDPESKLTENEISHILDTTLLKQHRNDPNVLRFISAYVRCRNGAQAAREAGLPPHTAHVLRARPDIHECIQRITDKSLNKYGFDAHEIVERVKEIAGIDPVELENPDGTFKTSLTQIPPEARRAIKSFKAKNVYETDANGIKVVTGQLIEVQFWDKMKAVELLGREKNIFKETKVVEHDVGKNMSNILLESQRRADTHVKSLVGATGEEIRDAIIAETVEESDDTDE